MTVEADEIVVSALCDRSRIAPWGLFGGGEGETTAFLLRRARARGASRTFSEAAGTVSDTKFSNVRLERGDAVLLRSPSGGGYGPPPEREPELVAADVREGFVTARARRATDYGVVLRADGSGRRRGDAPAPRGEGA